MKSPARQVLEADRGYIEWLFNRRCGNCGRPMNVIHEIVPISHGKANLHYTNRIALCTACHEWAHSIGTILSIPTMQEARRVAVIRKFGREDAENQEVYNLATEQQLESVH